MKSQTDLDVWKGVAIDGGFEDFTVMQHMRVVATKAGRLEGEEELGEFHFHSVEVRDEDVATVVQIACKTLRPTWYFHLVKGTRMKILFRGEAFDITKDDAAELEAAKRYGLENGVHEDQIQFEDFFDNPYGD